MKRLKLLGASQKRWLVNFRKEYSISLDIKSLEGIIYLLRTGCQWRLLPRQFGAWQTIYHLYRSWSERPWFDSMLRHLLYERRRRRKKNPHPSTLVLDSQSCRSGLSSSEKGIDGNKRIKGIKRHIAVDSDGLPVEAVVTCANVHDSRAAYSLVGKLAANFESVKILKADNGYRGAIVQIVKNIFGIDLQCVKSNYGTLEFVPLEGRWVVERTISWLDNFRRLCRNYECSCHTALCMTRMAMLMILIKHL